MDKQINDYTNKFIEAFKKNIENLKKEDKPYCHYCFDNNCIKYTSENDWYCEHCEYVNKLLNYIKNIS